MTALIRLLWLPLTLPCWIGCRAQDALARAAQAAVQATVHAAHRLPLRRKTRATPRPAEPPWDD